MALWRTAGSVINGDVQAMSFDKSSSMLKPSTETYEIFLEYQYISYKCTFININVIIKKNNKKILTCKEKIEILKTLLSIL